MTGELLLGKGKGEELRERRSEGSSGQQRGQWLGRFWRAREGIGEGIGIARSVSGGDGKLRDEGQLALLVA